MSKLPARYQYLLAALFAGLMLITRSPQLGGFDLLHAGSWALFLAAGVYLRGGIGLPLMLTAAFLADAYAVGWAGVNSYCLTPSYAMLLPAYASLWAAGRWYSGQHHYHLASLVPLTMAAFVGALLCEAFSSGGFYWFSGQFAQPAIGEFLSRELVYFPAYFTTLMLWLAAMVIGHVAVVGLAGGADQKQSAV